MKTNYLICYDISNPKRLRKVYGYLRRFCLHIQFSVFFARLDYDELMRVKEELRRRIDEKSDDIRIYPLTSDAKFNILGAGNRVPDGVEMFFDK